VKLTPSNTAQSKVTAWLATMPRNAIAYAPIHRAAHDLRFGHCGSPSGITGLRFFILFQII